jgi:hypothetical protein
MTLVVVYLGMMCRRRRILHNDLQLQLQARKRLLFLAAAKMHVDFPHNRSQRHMQYRNIPAQQN